MGEIFTDNIEMERVQVLVRNQQKILKTKRQEIELRVSFLIW